MTMISRAENPTNAHRMRMEMILLTPYLNAVRPRQSALRLMSDMIIRSIDISRIIHTGKLIKMSRSNLSPRVFKAVFGLIRNINLTTE